MASDMNSMAGNPTLLGRGVNRDQNTTHVNSQDQALLKALQDLIVRVMDPKQNKDLNQINLGPEAGSLITALQEFISSIVVGFRPGVRNTTIEVNLEENELQGGDLDDDVPQESGYVHSDGDNADNERSFPELVLPMPSFSEFNEQPVGNHNSEHRDILEKPPSISEEKLLRGLREHVFNTMPIRMLCFEPHGKSSFQISLIERGAIYGRIALELRGKLHDEEFCLKKLRRGVVETEQAAIKRLLSKYARYSILSHTWLHSASGSEVTYGDWNKGVLNTNDGGYRKLVNFCKTAWKHHRLTLGWMDTVCINKDSSSELDESIRSMYDWYSRAAVCIIYLAETETLQDVHLDPWFTRGWTLQELLAPDVIKFYSAQWKQLVNSSDSDKYYSEIRKEIEQATTISRNELWRIREAPISRRMQLAATREVTREEDAAYSLMGIFDVSISTAYGEGAARAFSRLLQEMLVSSTDILEILNWAGALPNSPRPYNSNILPSSARSYINRSSNKSLRLRQPTEPLTLTHLGLRIPLILMPGISIGNTAFQYNPIGDYNAIIHISPAHFEGVPTTYHLLDNSISGPDGGKDRGHYQLTFAVFNFSGAPDMMLVPKTCIAFGLRCYEPAGTVSFVGDVYTVQTHKPIVFNLDKRTTIQQMELHSPYWHIKRGELVRHGMQYISLYL